MSAIANAPTNHAAYDAAMNDARILGDNFRTANKRKRALAVNFIRAAMVEGFQLEALVEDCRASMKWGKLDASDRNQANVFFSALRTIAGVWHKLPTDVQKAFLAGEKVYSTLVADIKAAKAKAEKAEAEADAKAEAVEEAGAHAEADTTPRSEPPAKGDDRTAIVQAMDAVRMHVIALEPGAAMGEDEAAALLHLMHAIDGFKAAVTDAAQARIAA